MTPLARLLRERIAQDGPITVDTFMREALTHPQFGYYMTRNPLGRAGDFVTAPEVSQIFGEMIGLWCADLWPRAGAPRPVNLVELGPGRGTLMADALRAGAAVPGFGDAVQVHLVEASPVLREYQARMLGAHRPTWHGDVDDLPDGPSIVVANEFFDALPVRQFVRQADAWAERCVGLDPDSGGLAFVTGPVVDLADPPIDSGDVYERSAVAEAVMQGLVERLRASGGALLMVDYGHVQDGCGETLQAVRAHERVPVLAAPGEADLTAHVSFARLSAAARAFGARVCGPADQGVFLRRLGAEARAAALCRGKDEATRRDLVAGLRRLIDPTQMGTMFKVLAVTHPDWPAPDGLDACS